MSFDLGVWCSDVPMGVAQASSYYDHINEDWVDVRRSFQFDLFLKELTARFPDLRSPADPPLDSNDPPGALTEGVAEMKAPETLTPEEMVQQARRDASPPPEDSPWAATLEPTGCSIALPIQWSRVKEVAPAVVALARRFHLISYDPQENRVYLPPDMEGRLIPALPAPRVILKISGTAPKLSAKITLDGRLVFDETTPSRRDAHRQARALTLQNGLPFYRVKDPGSMMQGYTWAPVPPGQQHPPALLPGVEVRQLVPKPPASQE